MNTAPASITCPRCGRTSHNPNDVREGYCGACHDWTGAIKTMAGAGFRGMYYDRDGNEISLARWAWLQRPEQLAYRRVAEDTVNLYWVSTVWLGMNMNFLDIGPPIIFETMVFLSGTPEETGQHRYADQASALAGHEAIVAELRVLEQRAADAERIRDGGGE